MQTRDAKYYEKVDKQTAATDAILSPAFKVAKARLEADQRCERALKILNKKVKL